MIFPDNPILTHENDQLGLHVSSDYVANLIVEHGRESSESFVLGINGERGEGRSSFMHLLEESIRNQNPHLTSGTLFINPWLFHTSSDMIKNIFEEYAQKVKEQVDNSLDEPIKKYGKTIAEYVNNSVELQVSEGPFSLKIGRVGNKKREEKENQLAHIRNQIQKKSGDLKTPIILFVDHIDQLDPIKAKFLIRTLETIRREFPYTTIVLTYDIENLAEKLTEPEEGIIGQDVVNALVDVPYVLPKPSTKETFEMAKHTFDKVFQAVGTYKNSVSYSIDDFLKKDTIADVLSQHIPFILETPREIKQCASSLCLNLRVVEDAIDPIDMLAIHILKFKFPAFYYKMKHRDYIFLVNLDGAKNESTENFQSEDQLIQKYKDYLKAFLDKKHRKPVDRLCKQLFPQLRGEKPEKDPLRPYHICFMENYHKYMVLPVDED